MTAILDCRSFHSVKGGVGKSTLAVAHARALAHANPEASVFLIDLDLTGTSLADVLTLRAPRWKGRDRPTLADTVSAPDGGMYSPDDTRELVRQRDAAFNELTSDGPMCVPFLNDFLLFQPIDPNGDTDMSPTALCWVMDGAPDNLRIIPSSALPLDLERILPVIFDEYHSAFIEARLEQLLDGLVGVHGTTYLVLDVPPTIPGLSRAVMSLCMRLARPLKCDLSEDGGMPLRLSNADVRWCCYLVVSEDIQDVRAAARWLVRLQPDERNFVRLVVNRHVREKRNEVVEHILGALRPRPSTTGTPGDDEDIDGFVGTTGDWRQELEQFINSLIPVKDQILYRFFRGDALPSDFSDPLSNDDEA